MKKILMIGTGGTIASEMTPEGLTPELNTHQLLSYLPRIAQLCHVDCIQLYSLDSTSIHPTHWLGTAQAIREHYDSKRNLTDAFLYACRGCGGVQIVFNGRVILGTRARKTYSKSFRAFSSVNYPDLAVVQDEHLLQYIRCESRPRPLFYDRLDPHVGLLKLIPGTEDALAEFMLDRYDGLIIESFGVGGLPEYDGGHLYDVVRRGVERGKIVVMTTQVPNEGSDLTVYHVGGHLKSTLRLLEAYDMTAEAAVAKLMWIMGQTREFSEVERLFYQPVAQDILRFGDE